MGEMQRGLSRMAHVCADALDRQAVGFQEQIKGLQASWSFTMQSLTTTFHQISNGQSHLLLKAPSSSIKSLLLAALLVPLQFTKT